MSWNFGEKACDISILAADSVMTGGRTKANLQVKRFDQLSQGELTWWEAHLASDADLRRAFLSHEFVGAVSQTLGGVVVLVETDGGKPRFVLPLQRMAGALGRFGIYEPPGGVMTDYFGLVAGKGTIINAEALLAATGGKINAVLFSHLDETQQEFGLTGSELRVGLRVRLPAAPSNYWENLRKSDKKLVYDTERRERKIVSDVAPLNFEWASSQPEKDIDWLITSKKAQYARTGKAHAPLFDAQNANLLHRLLKSKAGNCCGQLSVLRARGEIVAAHFGLRCQDVLHVWFPVYNPAFASYSPGRILFRYMLDAAAENGITLFDRGEGDSQAKRDFANEEHRYARGLWLAPGWRGQLSRIALAIRWRIDRWCA